MTEKKSEDVQERLKPMINACYPGTLSALNLAVLQIIGKEGHPILRMLFSVSALLFLLSTFFVFFYTIYNWKKRLWTVTAITFVLGLCGSLIAAVWLIIV